MAKPGVRRNNGAWEAVHRDNQGKVIWSCGHHHNYRDRSFYGLRGELSAWACAQRNTTVTNCVAHCDSPDCTH